MLYTAAFGISTRNVSFAREYYILIQTKTLVFFFFFQIISWIFKSMFYVETFEVKKLPAFLIFLNESPRFSSPRYGGFSNFFSSSRCVFHEFLERHPLFERTNSFLAFMSAQDFHPFFPSHFVLSCDRRPDVVPRPRFLIGLVPFLTTYDCSCCGPVRDSIYSCWDF